MPHPPIIDLNDITADFEQRHRDVMLDLVLTWGSLDGALGMLLCRARGLPFDQGASEIGKMPGSAKLAGVIKALRETPGGAEAARILKRRKKTYERHSTSRNRIAHSHCVGVWMREPNFIVFAVFERVAENDLLLEAIPIQTMQRATIWATEFKALTMRLVDAFDAAE